MRKYTLWALERLEAKKHRCKMNGGEALASTRFILGHSPTPIRTVLVTYRE